MMDSLQSVYPVSTSLLDEKIQFSAINPNDFAEYLENSDKLLLSHPYLADLARIEAALYEIAQIESQGPIQVQSRMVNPHLHLIPVQWQGLSDLLQNYPRPVAAPREKEMFVTVWRKHTDSSIHVEEASNQDLLALKIASENINSKEAAAIGNVSVATIDDILFQAVQKGILLEPSSKIYRPKEMYRGEVDNPEFFSAPTFTLQWHITQTCDLHCRHCYDRSARTEPTLDECIPVLDKLYDFCHDHHVHTQITFTGGNPLLYPHFNELYQEAATRGFLLAILGNPMPRNRIEEILTIQKPEFYQVSLEGLRSHNDYIRGPGHYDRVFDFLALLKELNIYSMVMLTLTRSNHDQVIQLAEQLREKVDLFTFNRLAMVGEGVDLASLPPSQYRNFLKSYVHAVSENPCMGLKDNLINILRKENNQPFFGGCAGRGCGAAFNFIALLPDGEVHACRKFPSFIGNLNTASLNDIYHGKLARQYRSGSQACSQCPIRPVCGGCPAVVHGFGLDIFTDRDPYCFIDSLQTQRD